MTAASLGTLLFLIAVIAHAVASVLPATLRGGASVEIRSAVLSAAAGAAAALSGTISLTQDHPWSLTLAPLLPGASWTVRAAPFAASCWIVLALPALVLPLARNAGAGPRPVWTSGRGPWMGALLLAALIGAGAANSAVLAVAWSVALGALGVALLYPVSRARRGAASALAALAAAAMLLELGLVAGAATCGSAALDAFGRCAAHLSPAQRTAVELPPLLTTLALAAALRLTRNSAHDVRLAPIRAIGCLLVLYPTLRSIALWPGHPPWIAAPLVATGVAVVAMGSGGKKAAADPALLLSGTVLLALAAPLTLAAAGDQLMAIEGMAAALGLLLIGTIGILALALSSPDAGATSMREPPRDDPEAHPRAARPGKTRPAVAAFRVASALRRASASPALPVAVRISVAAGLLPPLWLSLQAMLAGAREASAPGIRGLLLAAIAAIALLVARAISPIGEAMPRRDTTSPTLPTASPGARTIAAALGFLCLALGLLSRPLVEALQHPAAAMLRLDRATDSRFGTRTIALDTAAPAALLALLLTCLLVTALAGHYARAARGVPRWRDGACRWNPATDRDLAISEGAEGASTGSVPPARAPALSARLQRSLADAGRSGRRFARSRTPEVLWLAGLLALLVLAR